MQKSHTWNNQTNNLYYKYVTLFIITSDESLDKSNRRISVSGTNKNIILGLLLTSISSRSSFFLRRMFDSSSLSSRDRSSGTGKYREKGKWKSMCERRREGGAELWGWIKLIHLPTSQSESQGLSLAVRTCSMNPSQRHYSWPELIH